MNRLELLEGIALGATVAYLFDPDHGRMRRHALAARVGRATRVAPDATVPNVERRAIASMGHSPRMVAILRSCNRALGRALRRARPTPINSWDIPMATVNIDIDQGAITLRGTFPPVDEVPVGARPHRGFTRALMPFVDDEQ